MSLSSYAEIISKAFEEKNRNYVSENSADEKIQFGINFESKKYKAIYCKIEMFDDGICDIEAELPVKCPMLHYAELAYRIAEYNCLKRYGSWRLYIEDGKIINAYSFDFNEATTTDQFMRIFGYVRDFSDDEADGIIAICNKSQTLQSKVERKSGEKHKLQL